MPNDQVTLDDPMTATPIEPLPGSPDFVEPARKNPNKDNEMTLGDAYLVYLDTHLFPQTPAKITYEYPDNTETIRLGNQHNLTLPRKDSPIKISFETVLTKKKYPYTWGLSNGAPEVRESWTNYLWELKQARVPVWFEVRRNDSPMNVCMRVLLTDWSWYEDAEQDDDVVLTINLIEYCEQHNQEIDASLEHHLIANRVNRGWAARRGR